MCRHVKINNCKIVKFWKIIADGKAQFPLVMVGGVLESNKKWDIGREVIKCISKVYPGVDPIHPEVLIFELIIVFFLFSFYNLSYWKRFTATNFNISGAIWPV
jgi:hypothetical protein